jgi:hypothetical protein
MEIAMRRTETTRIQYRREGLRYASDATEEEWALIAPRCRAGGAKLAGSYRQIGS